MRVITKNGWYGPNCMMVPRLEPWTTPQELADDYFDILPSKMIIVVPPAGYKFRDGVSIEDHPTKADVVPMEAGDEAPGADPEDPEHPAPTSSAAEIKARLDAARKASHAGE